MSYNYETRVTKDTKYISILNIKPNTDHVCKKPWSKIIPGSSTKLLKNKMKAQVDVLTIRCDHKEQTPLSQTHRPIVVRNIQYQYPIYKI